MDNYQYDDFDMYGGRRRKKKKRPPRVHLLEDPKRGDKFYVWGRDTKGKRKKIYIDVPKSSRSLREAVPKMVKSRMVKEVKQRRFRARQAPRVRAERPAKDVRALEKRIAQLERERQKVKSTGQELRSQPLLQSGITPDATFYQMWQYRNATNQLRDNQRLIQDNLDTQASLETIKKMLEDQKDYDDKTPAKSIPHGKPLNGKPSQGEEKKVDEYSLPRIKGALASHTEAQLKNIINTYPAFTQADRNQMRNLMTSADPRIRKRRLKTLIANKREIARVLSAIPPERLGEWGRIRRVDEVGKLLNGIQDTSTIPLRDGNYTLGFGRKAVGKVKRLELGKKGAGSKSPVILGSQAVGLWDGQINEMMDDAPEYLGTLAYDELDKIPAETPDRFGVILNTLEKSAPRGKMGHWVALFVDQNDSVEYYDPFGEPPTEGFLKRLKHWIDKRVKPEIYLKLKINAVQHQDVRTSTCGYHAMRFLRKRFRGVPFPVATGYDRAVDKDKLKQVERFEPSAQRQQAGKGTFNDMI